MIGFDLSRKYRGLGNTLHTSTINSSSLDDDDDDDDVESIFNYVFNKNWKL